MLINPWIIYLTRAFPYGKTLVMFGPQTGVLTQTPPPLVCLWARLIRVKLIPLIVGGVFGAEISRVHCPMFCFTDPHGITALGLYYFGLRKDCGNTSVLNDTPHVLRNCEDQFGYVFAVK